MASRKTTTKKKTKTTAKKKKRAPPPPRQNYNCFVIKSEPFVYSFDQLINDERTSWDGVRNFEARNNLRAMKHGDTLLYYHSNEGKEIVGIARVAKEAYQDPTTDEDWTTVDVVPVKKLEKPVSLATLKAHPVLKDMGLVKKSRISVTGVTDAELREVLALAKTKL